MNNKKKKTSTFQIVLRTFIWLMLILTIGTAVFTVVQALIPGY
ncbi:DUF4044 domain-containing protein [Pediococcus claussenii]|nr:DUF4044 domain-containing protein [Pediococcus claussenii]